MSLQLWRDMLGGGGLTRPPEACPAGDASRLATEHSMMHSFGLPWHAAALAAPHGTFTVGVMGMNVLPVEQTLST